MAQFSADFLNTHILPGFRLKGVTSLPVRSDTCDNTLALWNAEQAKRAATRKPKLRTSRKSTGGRK